ncbi:MAG: hypothetical protein LC808_39155, partial [Actinobacteria bacterium]|nr:hypothetical protein [Actinomycetota bacterium]
LGRLRLDLIAFRHVVIPDSHLFDGMYFLMTDPADLLPAIRRVAGEQVAPLLVKTRSPSLGASLRRLLARDEFLNSFPFNCIKDRATAGDLAEALRRTPARKLESWMVANGSPAVGLASFLRELTGAEGLDAGESLDQMEAGWAKWLEAEQRGTLVVQQWDRPYDLPSAALRSYIDPSEFTCTRRYLSASG